MIVALLCLLYLLGNIEIQSLHSVVHNSKGETELHSAENELNGCHQSIYHNQKEKGCEHTSHLIAVKKCPLCQLTIQSLHLSTDEIRAEFPVCKNETLKNLIHNIPQNSHQLLSPRAPPIA